MSDIECIYFLGLVFSSSGPLSRFYLMLICLMLILLLLAKWYPGFLRSGCKCLTLVFRIHNRGIHKHMLNLHVDSDNSKMSHLSQTSFVTFRVQTRWNIVPTNRIDNNLNFQRLLKVKNRDTILICAC